MLSKNLFSTVISLLLSTFCYANLTIYKAGATLVTGTWAANSPTVLSSTATDSPYEGNEHYKFSYTTSGTWAGFGLNMDNWYSNAAGAKKDFSGYTHLRLAYRGGGSGHTFSLKLRSNNNFGNTFNIGGNSGAYSVIDIPMASLINVNGVLASSISEIDFEVISPTNVETGILYLDAVELVNIAPPSPIANATCLARAAAMGKGFNTSNWLEAYWRISSNTYPDPSDYTRAKFQEFKNAGFTHVRLPVIFELISNSNTPYTLNTNHLAFKLVDSAIVWANDFNLKLIIDNHHGEALTDANFATEKLRKCAVWRQLVQRYGNLDPNRFMFELYNEPNGISNTNWRNVAQAIVDTIRSINTTHTLIIGGNGWNSINGMTSFTPLTDSNIIYTFHTYDPYLFTHQGMSWTSPAYFSARTFPQGNELNEIRSLFTTAKSWSSYYGVPIYMGEFGVGTPADATSRCNWVSHLTHLSDSLSIPWAYWDAKNYNDAFGFYPGGLAQANIIPCFKTALNLYSPTLAVSEITNAIANCNAKSIDIQWLSEVTQRTGTFNIESSNDGFGWETVLSEKARLGQNRYKKSIALAQQQQYFRVVYIDVDGSKTSSAIMTSNCKLQNSLIVFPNPISEGELNIAFQVGAAKRVKINLINSNGQTIQQFDYQANAEDNNIKINTYDLAKGLYFIQLWTEDNEMVSTKLTVY